LKAIQSVRSEVRAWSWSATEKVHWRDADVAKHKQLIDKAIEEVRKWQRQR